MVIWEERTRNFYEKFRNLKDLWDRAVSLTSLRVFASKEFVDTSYFFIINNCDAIVV